MDVGYLDGIEIEILDDMFSEEDDDELQDICVMDQLLYGYYYEKDCDNENWVKVSYTVGEWLDLWHAYVEDEKDYKNNVWKLRESMNSWEDVEYAMGALECIKKEDPELFYELFTSHFVSCFLYEIVDRSMDIPLDKRRVKKLAKWVQKNKGKEFSTDDFWRVIGKNIHSIEDSSSLLYETPIRYSKLWRICCQKPIYLSCKNQKQRRLYDSVRNNYSLQFGEVLENFLVFCDGVVDNENLNDPSLLYRVLNEDNTELFYKVLKKNVITKKTVQNEIEKVMEQQKTHLIPMLMLKVSGEWEW